MSNFTFNAAEVAVTNSFDPIPAGTYQVMITGAEVKNTKAGGGSYLSLEYPTNCIYSCILHLNVALIF